MKPKPADYTCCKCGLKWTQQPYPVTNQNTGEVIGHSAAALPCKRCGSDYMVWENVKKPADDVKPAFGLGEIPEVTYLGKTDTGIPKFHIGGRA